MKNLTKRCSMLTAIVAATVLFSGVAPVALAADDAAGQGSVVATRSFPKVSAVKKNILAESTSTEVEQDSDWGGVESLDVPQPSLRPKRTPRSVPLPNSRPANRPPRQPSSRLPVARTVVI